MLPPPPAPQLTHLHLRYPKGPWGRTIQGAKLFRKDILPRLKYHNPALSITIENEPGQLRDPMTLTLTFESTDPDALKAIAQKSQRPPRPQSQATESRSEPGSREEMERQARKQSPNWRTPPSREEPSPQDEEASPEPQNIQRPSADDDEVVLKPQPPANPSSPSTTSPPQPVYIRSVTLGLGRRPGWEIWSWFKLRTKCQPVRTSTEDVQMKQELEQFARRAEHDRRRVKAGMDAMKREKEDLKRAREAADRLATEA